MAKTNGKPAAKQQRTEAERKPEPTADVQAIRIPTKAAVWGLQLEKDGAWERCKWHTGGQAIDRWAIDSVPDVDRIARGWGRGRFKLLFFKPDGTSAGVSRPILIDDPNLRPGSAYPNKPATPAAPPVEAPVVDSGDRMAKIMAIAKGGDPVTNMAMLFSLLDEGSRRNAEDADRRAAAQIERDRERARELRQEDEDRHRRQMQEDDARWQRRLKEEEDRSKRALALAEQDDDESEIAELRDELAAMKEGGSGGDGDGLGDEVKKLVAEIRPHVPKALAFIWAAIGDKVAKEKETT